MIANKKFMALATFALLAGLSVGLVQFYPEFSRLRTYPIVVDVVYAYFRTYEVGENVSGLGGEELVSYVVVLNVTNPTSETVRIKNLGIHFAETASRFGQGVQMINTVINFERDFSDGFMDYYWYPNSSRLIAFGATGEISNLGMAVLKTSRGYFYILLDGRTQENAHAGGSIIKEVALETINDCEFVYNIVFEENERFHFANDELGISLSWAYPLDGE